MQNSFLKLKNISLAVLLSTLILTVLRTALLIFGFDYESSFFANDTLAYSLFGALIIVCAVILAISRSITPVNTTPQKGILSDLCISLAAVIFVSLAVIYVLKTASHLALQPYERNPLKTVSCFLCLPFSVLSVLYYVIRLFSTKEKSGVALLAVSPVIFLGALLLERFATVSASAASLSHFPDIIALLTLAYLMLSEGKSLIPSADKKGILPAQLTAFIVLTFSAVPDLILFVAGQNVLNFEGIVFMILKLDFIAYTCIKTIFIARDMKEVNE